MALASDCGLLHAFENSGFRLGRLCVGSTDPGGQHCADHEGPMGPCEASSHASTQGMIAAWGGWPLTPSGTAMADTRRPRSPVRAIQSMASRDGMARC